MSDFYTVIAGRRGGKTAAMIRIAVDRSVEQRKPVAVMCEYMKNGILEEAARRGVTIPDPVVVKAGGGAGKGITFAGAIVDKENI